MASGMLQDSLPSPPSTSSAGPRFRPYASPTHQVTKGRYITSNDPRGYIPVYEYPLNGQWIMMDIDDGYILWTGIWKALGNSKADIVKMIDSEPDLAKVVRRVRGGYLKIQGTWMPYEVAMRLSRRVAYPIRDDLVPLFGPTFPSTCMTPEQPGYGQVVVSSTRRRARRPATQPAATPSSAPLGAPLPGAGPSPNLMRLPHYSPAQAYASPTAYRDPYHGRTVSVSNSYHNAAPSSYPQHHHLQHHPSYDHMSRERSPRERERTMSQLPIPGPPLSTTPRSRYSPYPSSSRKRSISSDPSLALDIPALALSDRDGRSDRFPGEEIVLPPLRGDGPLKASRNARVVMAGGDAGKAGYALPPISALEDLRGISTHDSARVLQRLKAADEERDVEMSVSDRERDREYERERERERSREREYSSRQRRLSVPQYRSPQTSASAWPRPTTSSYSHQHYPYPPSHRDNTYLRASPSSHEDSSAGGISPVSPATPRSADLPPPPTLVHRASGSSTSSGGVASSHDRRPSYSSYAHGSASYPAHVAKDRVESGLHILSNVSVSACRASCDESPQERGPMRPW